MPKFDSPQPSTTGPAGAPSTGDTVVPTERSLYDLCTGGWRRHLTGLPTALRGTLTRRAGQGRSTVADRPDEPGRDTARR